MKLLIKDTTVVTGNDQRTVLYNAGIVIEDRRISDIGTSIEVESRHPLATVIQGRGRVVFPGLIYGMVFLLWMLWVRLVKPKKYE